MDVTGVDEAPAVNDLDKIIDAATEGWSEVSGLPSRKGLSSIIRKIYQLSLSVDEGRYPQLILAFLGHRRRDQAVVPLGSPRPHLADVFSLAPAIPPPPSALIFSGDGNPRCDGIVNLGGATPMPGAYIGIRGPGEIEVTVCRDDQRSWLLMRGAFQQPRDVDESTILRNLCVEATSGTDRDSTEAAALLRHVIFSVLMRGHGGALLFSDTRPASATHPVIDYRLDPLPLLPRGDQDARDPRVTATIVSCLTQIDGAVLLNSRLEVLGSGIFLDQKQTSIWLPSDSQEVSLGTLGLGSRHRSAAWFCQSNPGARAIVISRDRGIRVFGPWAHDKVALEGPYTEPMVPF